MVQNACDEVGIIKPSAVAASTNPELEKMLRMANKVGKRLQKIFDWQILTKERTFTSVGTEEQTGIFTGITDFDRFIPETFWNRSQQFLISGPISSVDWQGLKATSYSDTERRKFRHRGGLVYVIPTLSSGDTIAFEYVSKNWCAKADATPQSSWILDTDTGLLDEELMTRGIIYEYLANEGLPSQGAAHAYEEYYQALTENDRPSDDILTAGDMFGGVSQGRHFGGAPPVAGTGGLF